MTRFRIHTLAGTLLLLASTAASQTCTVSSFGQPCAATLQGSLPGGTSLRLDLAVPGNTGGLLVAGVQPIRFVLPAGCPLHVFPLVHLPYRVGMAGTTSWQFAIPRGLRGTFRCQAIPILPARPGVLLRSSNAIDLVCR